MGFAVDSEAAAAEAGALGRTAEPVTESRTGYAGHCKEVENPKTPEAAQFQGAPCHPSPI
jgi:hypothetical protein